MSWNLWWRFGGRWREREPRILEILDEVAPDLLGLQETWRRGVATQAGVIAQRLGHYAVFAPTSVPPLPDPVEYPDQAGVEVGIALVSRWPVLDAVDHLLPARHRPAPTALHVTVDHPAGPLHVIVACTEWEPRYADDHLAQTRALAALLADPALDGPLPVVLLGDLNAAPGGPEIAPLAAVASDLWSLGGGAPDAVTLSSAMPDAPLEATKQIDRRIDYAFARPGRSDGPPLRVSRSFLAGDAPIDGLHPSDHAATVSDLEE